MVYHGGTDTIGIPVIKAQSGGRDFGRGFYCTDIRNQAEKWAIRQGRIRKRFPILNIYEFDINNAQHDLSCKIFNDYSTE